MFAVTETWTFTLYQMECPTDPLLFPTKESTHAVLCACLTVCLLQINYVAF